MTGAHILPIVILTACVVAALYVAATRDPDGYEPPNPPQTSLPAGDGQPCGEAANLYAHTLTGPIRVDEVLAYRPGFAVVTIAGVFRTIPLDHLTIRTGDTA